MDTKQAAVLSGQCAVVANTLVNNIGCFGEFLEDAGRAPRINIYLDECE